MLALRKQGASRRTISSTVFHDDSSLRIYQATANDTVPEAVAWTNQHVGQPYFDRRAIAEVTRRFAGENPQETFDWLQSVNTTLLRSGDEGTAGHRELLDVWKAKEGPAVVETWLNAQASHPHYDHIASQYAALVAEQNPNKAFKWANTVKDSKIKQGTLQVISRHAPRAKP